MYRLPQIFVMVLFCLFLFSCATMATKPVIEKYPDPNFYIKKSPWESSFNPHEILRYWTKLKIEYFENNLRIVRVGNPRIDWTKIDVEKQDLSKIPVPEGDVAAVVSFLFIKSDQIITLFGYGYKDELGIGYLYQWDNEKKIYKRIYQFDQQRRVSIV